MCAFSYIRPTKKINMKKYTINLNSVTVLNLDGEPQAIPDYFCKLFGNNIYMNGTDIDEKDAGRLIHDHSKKPFVDVTESEFDCIVKLIREKSNLGVVFKDAIYEYAESLKKSVNERPVEPIELEK